MENATATSITPPGQKQSAAKGKKPKPKATVEKKPSAEKPMPSLGYDDNTWWKVTLAGSLGDGLPSINIPTARKNLLIRLRWSRSKALNTVTKADVSIEQVGVGYDKLDYLGESQPSFDNGTKVIHWFQHTIIFEIHFTSIASPLLADLGQTLKVDVLKEVNSTFAGTVKGWYDISSGMSDLQVFFT
jgi:hypothetical protein